MRLILVLFVLGLVAPLGLIFAGSASADILSVKQVKKINAAQFSKSAIRATEAGLNSDDFMKKVLPPGEKVPLVASTYGFPFSFIRLENKNDVWRVAGEFTVGASYYWLWGSMVREEGGSVIVEPHFLVGPFMSLGGVTPDPVSGTDLDF